MASLDYLIKDVRIVRPKKTQIKNLDIGIKNGKFAKIAPDISPDEARHTMDGGNLLAFPGVVDAHMHFGIYNPLRDDATTESQACAMGGVTSSLNTLHLASVDENQGGSFAKLFPEILDMSDGLYHVDYAYHLAPRGPEQMDEIEMIVQEFGATSLAIDLNVGLTEHHRCDLAHLEAMMRRTAKVSHEHPSLARHLSLSLYCEAPDITTAYRKNIERGEDIQSLSSHSDANPPHAEALAISMACYLANETQCTNINLLRLSSTKAMRVALQMEQLFPRLSFGKEVTIGHLLLDVDAKAGSLAKINPPLREREDVECLWQNLLDGTIDWVTSGHTCCPKEMKLSKDNPQNIFQVKPGFGGTEYLLPILITEGSKRGLPYHQVAELLSWNPAQRFGLLGKGDIDTGYDADLVLVDPQKSYVIDGRESKSAQGYSPFDGQELSFAVEKTFLRGQLIYDQGSMIGDPQGRYLKRPYLGSPRHWND